MNAKLIAMAAAAAAAATSAQAADLPVAAEPVDYVQACDSFGAGFFQLPGKDTCIKVGGRIRAQATSGNFKKGADGKTQAKNYEFYTKGYLYLTSMTDTEIGMIKTYTEFAAKHDQAGDASIGIGNAYIDLGIAGGQLVIGRAGSKFNGFTGYAAVGVVDRSMFDNDVLQVSYTANLGNGISAAVSLEDSNAYGGADNKVDFVGALEAKGDWGSAKIAAAAHQNKFEKTGYGVNGKVELDLGQYVAGTKVAFGAAYAKDALAYVDAKNSVVSYTAQTLAEINPTADADAKIVKRHEDVTLVSGMAGDKLDAYTDGVAGLNGGLAATRGDFDAAVLSDAEIKAAKDLGLTVTEVVYSSADGANDLKGTILGQVYAEPADYTAWEATFADDAERDAALGVLRAKAVVGTEQLAISNKLAGSLNAQGAKAYALSGGLKFALSEEVTFAIDGSYQKITNSGSFKYAKAGVVNESTYGYDFDRKAYGVDGSLAYAPVAGLVLALDAGWQRVDTTTKYDTVDTITAADNFTKKKQKSSSKTDTIKVGARVQYTF